MRASPARRRGVLALALASLMLAGPAVSQETDAAGAEAAEPLDTSRLETEQAEPELPVTRFESRLAFESLLEAEDYEAAVAVGERMVELTVDEHGAESIETGNAYAALGRAQRAAGDYAGAEESYLRSVEIMRNAGGPYSEHLIDPLLGLGDTYHADEQHLEAVSAYNEARSVNRRVFGLLNEDQLPILERMAESFYAMDEFAEAEEHQLEALRLIERVYEPHSPETLDAIYRYADWLRRNNAFTRERELYTRALRTIRDHYGDEHALLVEPLRRMGNSYRQQRAAHAEGIRSLTLALDILTAQPDPDPLELARVLRDIGDWNTAFSPGEPTNDEYRRAWELLGQVENGQALRQEWFTGVHYVLREPHSTRGLSTDRNAVPGSVTVRMDLDKQGRSHNVVVVESDPPGFKDEAFMAHVRTSRFRPHMAGGEIVPAERLGLRFSFMYLPEDAP